MPAAAQAPAADIAAAWTAAEAAAASGAAAAPTTEFDPLTDQPEPSVGMEEAAAAPDAAMSAAMRQRIEDLNVFRRKGGGSSKINKKYIRYNKKGRKTFNINKKKTKNKRVNDR